MTYIVSRFLQEKKYAPHKYDSRDMFSLFFVGQLVLHVRIALL